jgi:osmotically-inducible protein OsmY
MIVDQAAQAKIDELNRMKNLRWPILEDQNLDGTTTKIPLYTDESPKSEFEGLIHLGQSVFLSDDQSIGRITNLLAGTNGQISYLVVRTSHLWGQNKILTVALVSDVSPKVVRLSVDQSEFEALPKYKTDAVLAEDIENALWNDAVLRVTDYHEVAVRVRNGIVTLSGHITGVMNQDRIESALGTVKGILGVRNQLVADDTLLLKVAETLVQIGRVEGNDVFAQVQNGVVTLCGKVISPEARDLAQQITANVPQVRAVINNIAAPGVDTKAEDQTFVEPAVGEKIYFRDSVIGIVKQVVINRNNRRVIAMVLLGRFPDEPAKYASRSDVEAQTPERRIVVPVNAIRYLTSESGFLLIDSTETTRYQNFDPAKFVAPNPDWTPPYPYNPDDVLLLAE